tara:strand:+ start:893 stop:1042 length:150 start_codon:yes stop_codon:yes gene_type:complete
VKFHEYWDNENKLLELSYKESIRQREERKLQNKIKKQKKDKSNESIITD